MVYLRIFTALVIALALSCTGGALRQGTQKAIDASHGPPSGEEKLPAGNDLPPPQWIGERFIVLRMPPMFRKFGYELYPSPKLGAARGPVDLERQLKNRRLRHEILAGCTLLVDAVQPHDSGFVVAFRNPANGTAVYGRTKRGTITGIVRADDVALARARWLGKAVFARRRYVNTYDTADGIMGSLKVPIDAPLEVAGVVPGMSPLPPQHIWVRVETEDGRHGFIPTYFTWTNVMWELWRESPPWEQDIYERNPRQLYDWDDYVWDQINAHNVVSGMTAEQVLVSWGEPISRDSSAYRGKFRARWAYEGQYLYFDDRGLVGIENRQ